ncbi:3-ketoacyl-CoA thiolase 1, peroxisomal [Fusarium oxysporum f. sp. albedinis]|nr:3-ketoacyl-CoA thiolase 1, peroxisomal [Fusarium oxysporum f. sp. albedinis]
MLKNGLRHIRAKCVHRIVTLDHFSGREGRLADGDRCNSVQSDKLSDITACVLFTVLKGGYPTNWMSIQEASTLRVHTAISLP